MPSFVEDVLVGFVYPPMRSWHISCLHTRRCSGNITLHCETALDALRSFAFDYPHFKLGESKARLLLMTAEPDALSRLEAEPICMRHFEIVPFPRGGTDKPYKQSEFAELPLDARIDDTERFLAEADILANYVDAAVVSANSNTGRLIFTRAGPARAIDEYRVRSVDLPWHVSRQSLLSLPSRLH